jgi:signal transduction histidine kinase
MVKTRTKQGGGIVVEVLDNGPGFDPKNIRKGGLGLRMVRSRLQMEANGALRIESDASGTRAIVELP